MDQRRVALAHFGDWDCLPELGGLWTVWKEGRVGEVRLLCEAEAFLHNPMGTEELMQG